MLICSMASWHTLLHVWGVDRVRGRGRWGVGGGDEEAGGGRRGAGRRERGEKLGNTCNGREGKRGKCYLAPLQEHEEGRRETRGWERGEVLPTDNPLMYMYAALLNTMLVIKEVFHSGLFFFSFYGQHLALPVLPMANNTFFSQYLPRHSPFWKLEEMSKQGF